MKSTMFRITLIGIVSSALLLSAAWSALGEQGGVTRIYKSATKPFDDQRKVNAAIGLPKDAILVQTRYQGGKFWTESRKSKIGRFKCSQCHNNKKVHLDKAAEIAHGEIVLNHGAEDKPLSCYTCHKKDARDYLVTEAGTEIDMDHSYQMCGQCHFRQKKDWAGGAHGKRIANWAGQRVVKNCTSCHDPHSPHFEKRWPHTYSRPLKK